MGTNSTDVRSLVARQGEIIAGATAERHEDMSERIESIRRACRSAIAVLALRADPEAVLAYRDPLPESSVDALARLRRNARRA